MRRIAVFLSVVAMAVFADAQPIVGKAEFSGEWTEASENETGRGRGRRGGRPRASPGSGWGPKFSIHQVENELIVERSFFSRGDLQRPLKYRYSLDGSETRNTIMMGRGTQAQVSTAAWEGDKLVITTIHGFQNPENARGMSYQVRQTLALLRDPSPDTPPSLVVETTRSGVLGGAPSTSRTVYRRN